MEKLDSRLNVTSPGAYIKPKDSAICKNCIFRIKSGNDGFKKGICAKYDHKPLKILYDDAPCDYYLEDTKDKVSSL